MFSRVSLLAGGFVGFLLALLVFYLANQAFWLPRAREEGGNQLIAEQAVADRKAEIERKGDDSVLRGMSDFDLCVDGLRSRRMPIDICDELRGYGSQ